MFNLFKKKQTPFGLGAVKSKKDSRTIQHEDLALAVPTSTKGGVSYSQSEILNQNKVGTCTSTALVQLVNKYTGKQFSDDFQYLIQKKFLDKNWTEGSSIFSALKTANKYGFLPIEHWTHTTQEDKKLPYNEYIAKLKAVPDEEITRLLKLCTDKIPGYVQVKTDPQSLAKAIDASKAGILVRYEVGDTWWIPSWLPRDINPLRVPKWVISGHAIVMASYDFTKGLYSTVANTWSHLWCRDGSADVSLETYKPTEAWSIVDKVLFARELYLGMEHEDVQRLQKFLNDNGYTVSSTGAGSPGNETNYFGVLTMRALIRFQKDNSIPPTGYFGKISIKKVNTMV